MFFHFLCLFSFFFFFFVECSKSDFFFGLNFVTISRLSSYVKHLFLGPSRGVGTPLGSIFFSFLFVFFFSIIFYHFLSFSFIFFHFLSFSFIFYHFLSFSFIFFHFLACSCIFFHFLCFFLFLFLFLCRVLKICFFWPQFRHDFQTKSFCEKSIFWAVSGGTPLGPLFFSFSTIFFHFLSFSFIFFFFHFLSFSCIFLHFLSYCVAATSNMTHNMRAQHAFIYRNRCTGILGWVGCF